MILHLSNDFSGSEVYKNLVNKLDKNKLSQVVYNPVRDVNRIGVNKIAFEVKESQIIYSKILNNHSDRIFYKLKNNKILKDVLSKVNMQNVDCIHAHTWYSDGGVAYELNKQYNIPYIIAIRNSDLNLFWKLPFLKKYGLEILRNASRVVLISKIYKDRVLSEPQLEKVLNAKIQVVPNGIDDYWIKNSRKRKLSINKTPQLLFIGKFSKGKNVMKLINAVESIKQEGGHCELNLIGGGGKASSEVLKHIKDKDFIKYHGRIVDKKRLKEFYRNSDIYTMPSKRETFGLVYIEALSQGIPVVFTKNEGIDGYYKNNIGEAVDCKSVLNIAQGIKKIISNYNDYDFNIENILDNHNWEKIAKEYIKIYRMFQR